MTTKICNHCGMEKSFSEFRLRQRAENGKTQRLYSNCKECEHKIATLTSELKRKAPPKPKVCDCCGLATDRLYFDHDHYRQKFRGWLCNNCNVGISRLGDNISGILKALKYLLVRTLF